MRRPRPAWLPGVTRISSLAWCLADYARGFAGELINLNCPPNTLFCSAYLLSRNYDQADVAGHGQLVGQAGGSEQHGFRCPGTA
jgi:hypothetical protein